MRRFLGRIFGKPEQKNHSDTAAPFRDAPVAIPTPRSDTIWASLPGIAGTACDKCGVALDRGQGPLVVIGTSGRWHRECAPDEALGEIANARKPEGRGG